ncbi:DUF3592 domain-containing protein [Reinekea sp. G2M2-21]|uniref:DUF3592 domain-containing protein n=1 Tax=Reinekea sp. G2M2-21 TaxID=2788942 RepID=UPI0018AC5150|nr:DUF3592 domain-containing protein [Reinekea sp. G2M2-21]
MAVTFRKPSWPALLFSLPFFGVGLGFLFISVIPTLYLGATVPGWDRIPATLSSVNLSVSHGDSTSYQAQASYYYDVDGQRYQGNQVGFSKGSDNVGRWQQNAYRVLKQAYDSNEPMFAYVHPDEPERVYLFADIRWGLLGFKLIFVVVFGGVGGGLFFSSFLVSSRKQSPLNDGVLDAETTATASSSPIYSSARVIVWSYLGIAVFIAAVSSPILFDFWDEWSSGNKAILIAMVFPVIAVGFFVAFFKEWLKLLKFGRSPLLLSPYPASVGGHLAATVNTNIAYQRGQQVRVIVSCINRYTSRSGGKSRTRETTIWHSEGLAYIERSSQGKTRLRFAFNLPDHVPTTTPSSKNYHFWRVDIDTTVGGTAFKRAFTVPVMRVRGAQPTQQFLADQHPQLNELTESRLALLHIEEQVNQLVITEPRFSYIYERMGGILFGAVFMGSGIGVSMAGAPFIFPLVFCPIGFLFFWISLRNLLTKVVTTATVDGLHQQRSFIGLIRKQQTIAADELSALDINKATGWESSQTAKRHFFTLLAKGRGKQTMKLIERVEGKEAATVLKDKIIKQVGPGNVRRQD